MQMCSTDFKESVLLMAIFILPSILSGCFGEDLQDLNFEIEEDYYLEPWERYGSDKVYDNSDDFSRVTENGSYGYSETGQSVFVPVPSITLADGGAGAAGGESAADEVEQDTASDVIGVEIYGVVYIYNPVPEVDDEQNILKLANPDNDNEQTAMRSPAAPEPTDG